MSDYLTKAGDVLDEICWHHYVFKQYHNQSSYYQLTDRADEELLENIHYMLVQQSPAQPLDVYLDAVLIANPQLLHYPLVLPEGLLIHLPKLSEFSQQQHANVISLWD